MRTKGDRYKCWYCGQEERCTADHFYPKYAGGILKVYSCRICQGAKGGMFPMDFLSYINTHTSISQEAKARIRASIETTMREYPMSEARYYNRKDAIKDTVPVSQIYNPRHG